MNDFRITLEWIEQQESMSRGTSFVSLPGEEYRALLGAARRGMGFPASQFAVFDYVTADNPNWRKYQDEQGNEGERQPKGRPRLRLVDK